MPIKKKDPGKKVIGQLTSAISGKQKIGAMMTDAITEIFNLDIAIQNSGGIRLDKIPAGDLTVKYQGLGFLSKNIPRKG